MAEKAYWNNYGFERTVWANMQLAKLCPGNNIQKLDELLTNPDTEKQFNSMMDIIEIMNKAFIRKYSKLEPDAEYKAIKREDLLDLDEDELGNLTVLAMGKYKQDGEVTVEAEPIKKEEAKESESSSTTAGSSTLATS